jgi:hypothetical protein
MSVGPVNGIIARVKRLTDLLTGAIANSSAFPDALEPNTQDAFKLHSRRGASRILYLDFDGHGRSTVYMLPIRV